MFFPTYAEEKGPLGISILHTKDILVYLKIKDV
jgi:hypothetical protein